MSDRPNVSTYETDLDGVEQLVHREMNDGEFALWQADRAAVSAYTTAQARAAKIDEIKAALAKSDVSYLRHQEDGQNTTALVAYRRALRGLIAAAASDADPASVQLPADPPLAA